MKFYMDMTLVTENGEALGYFDGKKAFKDIPTENEKSQLFDEKSQYLPFVLREYLQQSQVLENLVLYDKPNHEDVMGACFFSFFYIPTKSTKDTFNAYFEQYYGLYFWDFSED